MNFFLIHHLKDIGLPYDCTVWWMFCIYLS